MLARGVVDVEFTLCLDYLIYIAFPNDIDNNPLIPDGPFKKSLMNLSNKTSYERQGTGTSLCPDLFVFLIWL